MWELGVRPENPSRLLGQRKHLPEGRHRSLPAPVPPPSSFPGLAEARTPSWLCPRGFPHYCSSVCVGLI